MRNPADAHRAGVATSHPPCVAGHTTDMSESNCSLCVLNRQVHSAKTQMDVWLVGWLDVCAGEVGHDYGVLCGL